MSTFRNEDEHVATEPRMERTPAHRSELFLRRVEYKKAALAAYWSESTPNPITVAAECAAIADALLAEDAAYLAKETQR